MAYNLVNKCVTTIDKLKNLINTRNYLESRIESLEGDLNIDYIRLQQVNESIETLKEELLKEKEKQMEV